MITGYNTDVEYGGVVYHIQTEDKGVEHPVILSLVYVEGAILASKRSPYDDLIIGGFDKDILTQRLQRQHKLICAAVRAGRIEDLKRLGERGFQAQSSPSPKSAADKTVAPQPAEQTSKPENRAAAETARPDIATPNAQTPPAGPVEEEALQATLLEERELRGGESVKLRIMVTRAVRNGREPVRKARVTLKTLGTTFRPQTTVSTTDSEGIAAFFVALPNFTTGRAAILIRVEADDKAAELRRIILPG
ncbi:MAG: hypothetical protein ACMG6H_01665 [Acidobacteriota bacterium]